MSKLIEIDIKGGQMSYGERIELGNILSKKGLSNWARCRSTILCLHPEWDKEYYNGLPMYYEKIIEGIEFWINRENTELRHEPREEEIQAGCKALALKLGAMATIKALATQYSQDPDNIPNWKYAKVFNLLYTDLEQYKFSEELRKRQERKNKAKYKR